MKEEFEDCMKMNKTLKEAFDIFFAELVGTAIFVCIGCLGCFANGEPYPETMVMSLTYGIGVFMACETVYHISGAHLNPVVTIASVLMELTTIPVSLFYILGQFSGSLIGYALTKVPVPRPPSAKPYAYCVTNYKEYYPSVRALLMEYFATAIFVLVICSTWDKRNKSNTSCLSLKRGLAVFGLALATGPMSGCSLNPARSFAPVIIMNVWKNHYVYWIGPLMGACLAASLYKKAFLPCPSKDS